MNKMIYIVCENGHKVKCTGSIAKKSERGKSRRDRTPEVSKLCPRCHGKITETIEIE